MPAATLPATRACTSCAGGVMQAISVSKEGTVYTCGHCGSTIGQPAEQVEGVVSPFDVGKDSSREQIAEAARQIGIDPTQFSTPADVVAAIRLQVGTTKKGKGKSAGNGGES